MPATISGIENSFKRAMDAVDFATEELAAIYAAVAAARDEVQELYADLQAVAKERDELKAALDRYEQP
jgi:uncharacterized coiled-coil DUF342 family protein